MDEVIEDFRTAYFDPGEDFGWCLGRGTRLLAAGTDKMREIEEVTWYSLEGETGGGYFCAPDAGGYLREETQDELDRPEEECRIGRIVMENWRLYPEALQRLAWDECRTARVIGAIQFMARLHDVPCILQPALIKPAAQAAGCESFYYEPHHENRHQNDAIQHWRFYTVTELLGVKLPMPKSKGPA